MEVPLMWTYLVLKAERERITSRDGLRNRGGGNGKKSAQPEREIDGLREDVLEAKRGKRDVYICSSMQSTHVYVSKPSVMYSRQRWWMHPLSVTTLNFANPSTIPLLAEQAEPLHYSPPLLFWKWAALRMNLRTRQHKSEVKMLQKRRSANKRNVKHLFCFFNCNSLWGARELL